MLIMMMNEPAFQETLLRLIVIVGTILGVPMGLGILAWVFFGNRS